MAVSWNIKKLLLEKPPMTSTGHGADDLWTTKYAPKSVADIIGNQNFVRDIMVWLQDWDDVILKGQKKETKFNPNKSKG
jgi:replication factor C subunit 1